MINLSHSRLSSKNTKILRIGTIVFLMASIPNLVWGQTHPDDEKDTKEKVVAEAAWQLPPPPTSEDLLRFYVSLTTGQSFAIDAKSLTVDTDGVIRYTIVSTSSSGAKNISYEGIRCASHEKKLYALGHADGTWARARNPDWEPISGKGANLQHATLANDYFCKDGLTAGKADKILDAIRYHRVQ
jgi:hypothetical protein